MEPNLIGHVAKRDVAWYVLDDDSVVTFHKVYTDKEHTQENSTIIYSDNDTWPSVRAQELGISYTLMTNATTKEVTEWLEDNPHVVVEKVIEL